MKYRTNLFLSRDLYNLPNTDKLFIKSIKSNILFHKRNCKEYKHILSNFDFDINSINTIKDLYKIIPLPTTYLKNNTLLSKPYEKLFLKTTSSGTSGKKTLSGFDLSSALYGFVMLLRVFNYHNLISCKPTNYIVLGYEPNKSNQTAMAKALKGVTYFAPAKNIKYALRFKDGKYILDVKNIISSIVKFSKQNNPVRIIGFPAYLKMFLQELNKRNIRLNLPKDSKIIIGGGWKNLFSEQVSKEELFKMAKYTLNIDAINIKDHFSTAEHPINYVACKNNHFHVPIFSRVIIRDVNTLKPVPNDTPGILNLISPILSSAPYNSILTDDIAILHDGNKCGCGISSPYFEIIGRVGLANLKTCTQMASEFLINI